MDKRKQVVHVYVFPNGMVMAFNIFGEQMPDYQGPKAEAIPLIKRDFPNIEIMESVWRPMGG